MKLFTTDRGIARETSNGRLDLVDLPAADLGEQLRADPNLAAARSASVRETVALGDVELLAPILRPNKVIGIGINYTSHVEETREQLKAIGVTPPDFPVFFLTSGTAVVGPNDPIVLPAVAPDNVDYEIELGVVIGRGGARIAEADAMDHVVGYTLGNDVSARDIQRLAMTTPMYELSHAKGMDGFKPLGPSLVTKDEFPEPLDVGIQTKVNGEIRQDARTTELIHSVARCIHEITKFMTLDAGDVILTGSPSGVGVASGTFLKPGDVVEMTAEKIGTMRSEVVAAS